MTSPSFIVGLESQKHIDFALNSPYAGARPGRVMRRRMTSSAEGGEEGEEAGEEEEE